MERWIIMCRYNCNKNFELLKLKLKIQGLESKLRLLEIQCHGSVVRGRRTVGARAVIRKL